MECQYCQKILSSKISLNHHQKTNKSCLVIQGKGTDLYKCPCGTAFSIKSSFVRHQTTCGQKLQEQVRTSGTELEKLREQLREAQNEINRLQTTTEKLEHKLEMSEKINEHYFKLTETLATKPTTTNNTTTNTIIQNLDPMDINTLGDYSHNLSLEHIKKGAVGLAEYALEFPLKNKIACSDCSRKVCKYKNQEGQIITDYEMTILQQKICESIRERNQELSLEYIDSLQEKWGESYTSEIVKDVLDSSRAIINGAVGEPNEFTREMMKNICIKCKI